MNVSSLQIVSPFIKSVWTNVNKSRVLQELVFNDTALVTDYGAPQLMWLEIIVGSSGQLNMTLYIVNKTATRLPESLSIYFDPPISDDTKVFVTKLGSQVDVSSVVHNGSQHLHSSQTITYSFPSISEHMTFTSLDTSVLCVGYPNPFPTPPSPPALDDGFAFNIFNNIWGTNYITWYPYMEENKSSKYRFTLNYKN